MEPGDPNPVRYRRISVYKFTQRSSLSHAVVMSARCVLAGRTTKLPENQVGVILSAARYQTVYDPILRSVPYSQQQLKIKGNVPRNSPLEVADTKG